MTKCDGCGAENPTDLAAGGHVIVVPDRNGEPMQDLCGPVYDVDEDALSSPHYDRKEDAPMSTETKDRDDDDAKPDTREVREHVDETTTDKVTVERSEPAAPEKPHGDT